MTSSQTRPPHTAAVVAAALVAVCALLLAVLPADVASAVSDVAQAVAAAGAALAAARRALRTTDRRTRLTWALITAACAAWAAGESYWCTFTLRRSEVPFPSLADVGFLGFSVLMAAALVTHPHSGGQVARLRRALDGLLTAGAVGLLAWLTVLSTVAASPTTSTGADLLLLAYPSVDVLLVVLTVILLARTGRSRSALTRLSAGVLALGISDGSFAYLAASGGYDGGLIDLGWIGGFTLIALAGLCPPDPVGSVACRTPASPASGPRSPAAACGLQKAGLEQSGLEEVTVSATVLPYLPALTTFAVIVGYTVSGRALSRPEMLVACLVVLCLLARQYLAVRDNVHLARRLAAREGQLRRQAFTDPLTGLANRLLFSDRLTHVLQLHERDRRPVALVYLDLDRFKPVNDSHGHAAGDALLIAVAERLRTATRTVDTVARLGGDEFAVLLEDTDDPAQTAARITAALAPAFTVAGVAHHVQASIGTAAVIATEDGISADDLLARADAAMYHAKRTRGACDVVPG
jgi:diguanylate cyclase (GGDEF)-like protein